MQEERWLAFSKSQQLLMIGSELMRAAVWQHKDQENFRSAIERGLGLVDLCLDDPKWKSGPVRGKTPAASADLPVDRTSNGAGLSMLFWLRNELARFYIGEADYEIKTLYEAL